MNGNYNNVYPNGVNMNPQQPMPGYSPGYVQPAPVYMNPNYVQNPQYQMEHNLNTYDKTNEYNPYSYDTPQQQTKSTLQNSLPQQSKPTNDSKQINREYNSCCCNGCCCDGNGDCCCDGNGDCVCEGNGGCCCNECCDCCVMKNSHHVYGEVPCNIL